MSSRKVSKGGVIEAAGGVVWRASPEGEQIVLVHRPNYDDWTLPKGWRKKGETWVETAIREVEEETYCRVQVAEFAGCSCYTVHGVPKIVLFWHMRVLSEDNFEQNDEIDELQWMPLDEAIAKLSYPGEKSLLTCIQRESPTAPG